MASMMDRLGAKFASMSSTPSRVVSITPLKKHGATSANQAIQSAQAQQDAANAANEARFQKLMELAQRFGQSMLQDNANLTQQQMAGAGSNLVSRGLGNSTIVNAVQGGIQRQGQMQANRIQDMLLNNQMGIIERRTDQHPNLGLLAQLLMQPGALGG